MALNEKLSSTENHVLELKITQDMHQLGIPAHLSGYSLLREAIVIAIDDSESVVRITKLLYKEIAKKQKSTDIKVESAIRHAIEVSWTRGNVEFQKKIFGYSSEECDVRPTNSDFIAAIADYARSNYMD